MIFVPLVPYRDRWKDFCIYEYATPSRHGSTLAEEK